MVDVAIVLLNWNGWRDTLECLESVGVLNFKSYAIIVVDNASTDGSRNEILRWMLGEYQNKEIFESHNIIAEDDLHGFKEFSLVQGDFFYIQAKSNGGFAAGNNLGLRLAIKGLAKYVWLLNSDTIIQADALTCLVSKANSDAAIGICGSVLLYYHNREVIQAFGGVEFNFWNARGYQIGQGMKFDSSSSQRFQDTTPTYISGASMLVRTDLLLDVGLMEESYFLYYEEIDWAMRCRAKWKIAVASDSIVFHKEGGSIGTSSTEVRSKLSQYYLYRNLIAFYCRNRPVLLPIAILRVLREALNCIYPIRNGLLNVTLRSLKDGIFMKLGKLRVDL